MEALYEMYHTTRNAESAADLEILNLRHLGQYPYWTMVISEATSDQNEDLEIILDIMGG